LSGSVIQFTDAPQGAVGHRLDPSVRSTTSSAGPAVTRDAKIVDRALLFERRTASRRPRPGSVIVGASQPGFGASPHAPGIPSLTRLRARMKGALVTRLADPAISVVNTHPVANTDGDWSPANRFSPVHRAQLAALARVVRSVPVPAVVCGDFNVDRDSALFGDFIADTALDDAFEGSCPATFRAEYLPAGEVPHCIDFILTAGEIKAEDTEVLFSGRQVLRGGTGYVSDHLGLLARLNCLGA
jgi:hypothetical protein